MLAILQNNMQVGLYSIFRNRHFLGCELEKYPAPVAGFSYAGNARERPESEIPGVNGEVSKAAIHAIFSTPGKISEAATIVLHF
jgi:hypothetical protein